MVHQYGARARARIFLISLLIFDGYTSGVPSRARLVEFSIAKSTCTFFGHLMFCLASGHVFFLARCRSTDVSNRNWVDAFAASVGFSLHFSSRFEPASDRLREIYIPDIVRCLRKNAEPIRAFQSGRTARETSCVLSEQYFFEVARTFSFGCL